MSDVTTPIYIKETDGEPWPEEGTFYILSSSGLFLCRNHDMFQSCTPVRSWPSELAPQKPFLQPFYPQIPRLVMEQVTGFFGAMAEEHRCEAGVYLIYDRNDHEVTVAVPTQVSTVSRGAGALDYGIGLDYDNLDALPPHQMILGTVHSHVYGAAYSSGIDVHDEVDKPGLHIVVGKLDRDPPDLYAVAVVDGSRFPLDPKSVIEGYQARRDDFPREWIDQVTVKITKRWSGYYSSGGYDSGYGSSGSYSSGYGSSGQYSSGYSSGYGSSGHALPPSSLQASRDQVSTYEDDKTGANHGGGRNG